MDSLTETTAEHESERSKKIKRGKFTSQVYVQDETIPESEPEVSPANKLCEDELSLIFKNSSVSVQDLLNFRLVNKSWCDAATSTLLKKNACFVALEVKLLQKSSSEDKHGEDSGDVCFHQYGVKERTLTQLTDLISSSPKFPVTDFYVIARKKCSNIVYFDNPDLLSFFEIHGDKIRTFGSRGRVSLKSLLKILSTKTPNIKCLDIRDATLRIGCPEKIEKKDSNWISATMLILGDGKMFDGQTMHLLLSFLPNLRRIEHVDIDSLGHILNEGKGQLIRSFEVTIPRCFIDTQVTPLSKFVQQVQPQLFSLGLDVHGSCEAVLTSINAILESSKDTLEQLELSINQFEYDLKLRTFPMTNLQSMSVKGYYSLDDTVGQVNEARAFSIFWEYGMSVSKCFPNLFKLRLVNLNLKENLMCFFQFKVHSFGTTLMGINSCLPSVQVLEILDSILPKNNLDSTTFSKFFPNIHVVKMKCYDFINLSSSFWLLFPSVEFLEIFSIRIQKYDELNDVEALSSFADKFFTGFSSEMCRKLRAAELPEFLNNAEGLKSLRLTPCVCDLFHLKEMKLKFYELSAEFASFVTGKYAFSQMPNTKFIVYYDPEDFYCNTGHYEDTWNDVDVEKLCFASIKPYVQVGYEDWGDWEFE